MGSTASREILILQDVVIRYLVQQLGEKNRLLPDLQDENRKNKNWSVGLVDELTKELGLVDITETGRHMHTQLILKLQRTK